MRQREYAIRNTVLRFTFYALRQSYVHPTNTVSSAIVSPLALRSPGLCVRAGGAAGGAAALPRPADAPRRLRAVPRRHGGAHDAHLAPATVDRCRAGCAGR